MKHLYVITLFSIATINLHAADPEQQLKEAAAQQKLIDIIREISPYLSPEAIRSCLDSDANGRPSEGVPFLHYAAMEGAVDVMQMLLKKGADINILYSYERFTPLHLAASCGHSEAVTFLLQNGANSTLLALANWDEPVPSVTAAQLAERNGHFKTAQLIRDHMLDAKEPEGQ